MSWTSTTTKTQVLILPTLRHDVILALPALFTLAEQMEKDSTEWIALYVITPREHVDIVQLALERGLSAYAAHIVCSSEFPAKQDVGDLDTVYCLDRSFGAGFRAWRLGARNRIGFSSGTPAYFYTKSVICSWNEGYFEIEKNLDVLRARYSGMAAWSATQAPSLLGSNHVSPSKQDPVVIITFATDIDARHWPNDYAAKLCEILCAQGVEVWLVGDEQSHARAEDLIRRVGSLLIKNLCTTRSVKDLVDTLAVAEVVVSAELSTIHLCSDLMRPVVALLGTPVLEGGYAPWRRRAAVLSVANSDRCPACKLEALKKPVRVQHRCITQIAGDRVYREVRGFSDHLS